MSWDTSASISSRTTNATASRNRSPCSPAIALATTSAGVIIWPSAIVVLLLIGLLAKPTSLDATVVGTRPGPTRRPLHHFYRLNRLVPGLRRRRRCNWRHGRVERPRECAAVRG